MFGEKKETKLWSIETFVRLKPLTSQFTSSSSSSFTSLDYQISEIQLPSGLHRSALDIALPLDLEPSYFHNFPSGRISFEFDSVIDKLDSQETVFEITTKGNDSLPPYLLTFLNYIWSPVDKVLDLFRGINSTVFAYGQTGAGKTFTMFGGDSYANRGLIPRTINLLFKEIKAHKKGYTFKSQLSFLEVYKETVYDLLDVFKSEVPIEQWSPVVLQETSQGALLLKNLNVFEVTSEEEALNLFFMGNKNRITSSTSMNEASSRSHAIFTLVLETEGRVDGNLVTKTGKINLVDLAGSERVYKTQNSKMTIAEARCINLSLHYLEHVIISLRDSASNTRRHRSQSSRMKTSNISPHIPYRNSVLTNILRDSLGGNSRSSFIVNISLERQHFDESITSCRFGQRCGEVHMQYHVNSEIALADQIRHLVSKVREMDGDMQDLERERTILIEELSIQRGNFQRECLPRELTEEERTFCSSFPLGLTRNVSDKLMNNINTAPVTTTCEEDQSRTSTSALFEKDKAVLVALCTSLGEALRKEHAEGMQRHLVDKETQKVVEILRPQPERKRIVMVAKAEERQFFVDEMTRHTLEDSHRVQRREPMRQNLHLQSCAQRAMAGDEFYKHGKGYFNSHGPRFVHLSRDARQLLWRKLNAKEGTDHAVLLSSFSRLQSYRF